MPEYSPFIQLPGFHDIASGLQGLECGCVARQQRSECREESIPGINRPLTKQQDYQ
ncbi:hypothetical protein [Celerinatantimonas sp. YJH-8]|uniref:hypothetical protein n=1 Tax=Celerinatantimonas sp. YJH-8 TaxID=3228714 RepID=UPI0038C3F2C2